MAKEFQAYVTQNYKDLNKLNPQEIYNLSTEILGDKDLSKGIGKGNLNFLKKGVAYFDKHGLDKFNGTKYAPGMLKHIRNALPHQENFVASKSSDLSMDSKVEGYQRIVNELNNVRGLSLNGLVGLGKEITTDPQLSKVPGQENNLKIIGGLVDAYFKRTGEHGVGVAERFLRGAPPSGKIRMNTMINIISKSYLPNLMSFLNKETK